MDKGSVEDVGVPKWTFLCRLPGLWPHSTLAKSNSVVMAASTLLGKSSSGSLRDFSTRRVSQNALRFRVLAQRAAVQSLPHSPDACLYPAAVLSQTRSMVPKESSSQPDTAALNHF